LFPKRGSLASIETPVTSHAVIVTSKYTEMTGTPGWSTSPTWSSIVCVPTSAGSVDVRSKVKGAVNGSVGTVRVRKPPPPTKVYVLAPHSVGDKF